MTEPTGAAGLSDILRKAQEMTAHANQLQERLGALVGRAESPDGLVRVACTSTDPVHEVVIDPRAMRLASEDLSEALRTTVRQARADLDRQITEAFREQTGDAGPMALVQNPELARAKMAQLNQMVSDVTKGGDALMQQLRRQMGG